MAQAKRALLAVSFGTSYAQSREKTIGAVEAALKGAFPGYDVRRAFTSRIILKILKERDGLFIDDVETALLRLREEGYEEVLIQPTYMMSGIEYDEMMAAALRHRGGFARFVVGAPALDKEIDFKEIVDVLAGETREYNRADTAVVFMGHGSEHKANVVYRKMDRYFKDMGYVNYVMGTVEAIPCLSAVMEEVKEMGVKRVVLLPFMVVAGDHANNDMAGEDKASWKSSFENAGFLVECVIRGVGEYKGMQELFVRHAREAVTKGGAFS